jgi:hypothetical protein
MVMFCKSVFNPLVNCLTENEIDSKLQRENFYNLHKTGFLIVARFSFKTNKILSYHISGV